ncbi:ERVV2 protein, partial [Hirundo rustica]|nr:ERVV2 protein [Hirundo rustica]
FHNTARTLLPSYGVVELERAIVNISAVVEPIEWHAANAIPASREEADSLSHAVTENRIALSSILATQRGACATVNTTCCSYVDQCGKVKKDVD